MRCPIFTPLRPYYQFVKVKGDMDDMTFGEIIYTLRKRQKLSQGALAKKAGVARNTVSLIERSDTNVKLSTMIAVCRALGFDFAVKLQAKEARNEAPTE